MEKMSTIPAPVEAMISGPGSFFGSCQVASSNFEVAFQSAMVSNTASTVQGAVTDTRPRGFGMMDFSDLKTFSSILEEYGENEVLGNLQEILGEEAGKEAFELALLMAQNDEAFKQLSPEDQMEVFRLFKIMDMAKTATNDVKAFLEDWVKDMKNIFAELKIELKQPEELVSKTEEDTPLVAISPEDLKNIKLLAKEMGVKPKDAPKFAALVNSLLKNGVITSKDLKDTAKTVSEEPILAKEFIEGLWEFAKDKTKDEIENLVDGKIADLIGELIVDSPKDTVFISAKEPVVDLPKEPVVDSTKENISSSAKEPVVDLPKEPVVDLPKEPVANSTKEPVSHSAKEPVVSSPKKTVVDSAKEPVSDSAKKSALRSSEEPVLISKKKLEFNSDNKFIFDSAKENVSGLVKESVPSSVKENLFGAVSEEAFGLEAAAEDELVQTFHALLRKFLRGELTEEEKEKLKHILKTAEHFNSKNQEAPEEEELAIGEEESDSQADNGIEIKDPAKKNLAFEDLAFEEEVDIKLANNLFNPQKAEKGKRKGFNSETQQASQTQLLQQTLQTQPQQTQQAQHQVQPEVRAVWEGEGLKIELVNPRTGEKLQTTYETMPQKMQERINEFEVVRQVIAQAKFITTPTGEQKMTMQLRPEHLGQVDLRITLNHGEMQIHARVESVTAQSALETHIGLLREGLEKHGITLDRLEVSVEQRDRQDAYSLAERQDQREQKHSNRRHHRGREQHLAVSTGKDESSDTGRRLGYNTMEYLA
ncbi:MAG: flagellar hook-length control protein FliK [Fibromonadaceae bacterium]|jgi:flagellar hook-length control protein FliK|nr:flagellar hook-length control protein FliK [Fibromonadaceae bacterium]